MHHKAEYVMSSTKRQSVKGEIVPFVTPVEVSQRFTNNMQAWLQKVNRDISMGRIIGPFNSRPPGIENLRCSPLGLVPKRKPIALIV